MKTRIAIALFVTLTANAWAADKNRHPLVDLPLPERWLPLDEDGWTVVKPAADSRLIYVSNSEGNDETAQVYKHRLRQQQGAVAGPSAATGADRQAGRSDV